MASQVDAAMPSYTMSIHCTTVQSPSPILERDEDEERHGQGNVAQQVRRCWSESPDAFSTL